MRDKKIILLFIILLTSFLTQAQSTSDRSNLFIELQKKDSLLFSIGFNQCDMEVTKSLLMNDLEFYHDKTGITRSKDEFVEVFEKNVCNSIAPTVRRELIPGSLAVYPMYDGDRLYGAIQVGKHRFGAASAASLEGNDIARFTHLWLITNGEWKIARVLSYDH